MKFRRLTPDELRERHRRITAEHERRAAAAARAERRAKPDDPAVLLYRAEKARRSA